MAKVYEKVTGGKKEVDGGVTVTEAQAKAHAHWEETKSPAAKRSRAAVRQEERDTRSAAEQLALLDKRLGKGVGAAKERARLEALPLPDKSIKECAKIVKFFDKRKK